MKNAKFRLWIPDIGAFLYWGILRRKSDGAMIFAQPPTLNREPIPAAELLDESEMIAPFRGPNGEEIYAGDILTCEQGIHVVKYDEDQGLWMIGNAWVGDFPWHFELAGNVHQNPDLLEPLRAVPIMDKLFSGKKEW